MATIETSEYLEILKDFKHKIRNAQLSAATAVNTELLRLYWYIGASISQLEADSKWGTGFIKRLPKDLIAEFEGMEGFSETNLKYIRRWFQFYCPILGNQPFESDFLIADNSAYSTDNKQLTIGPPLGAQLTAQDLTLVNWSHHKVLLDKLKNPELVVFYIRQSVANGWSRNSLQLHIESKLHKRFGTSINNFSQTLPAYDSDLAREAIRNPYTFNFLNIDHNVKELDLEKALVGQLSRFLLELGRGFAFVGRQVHLDIEGSSYFPDLIFFNTRLKRYVVFELKVSEFDPAFIGQLQFYCSVVDSKMKEPEYEPTMGILLCRVNNKLVAKYSLEGSKSAIGISDFGLTSFLEELDDEAPENLPLNERNIVSEPELQYGQKSKYFPIVVFQE